jgi:hypothetical protein
VNSFAKAQNHFQNVHTRKEGKGKGVFLSSKISRKVVFLHLGEFQPTPLGVGLLCFEGPRGQDNGSPQEPVQQGALHGNQSPLDRQFMTTTMLPLREMIIVSFHRWGTGSKSRGLPRATQLGSGNVSSLCHESFSYCHFLIILGIDLRLLHASSLKFKVNTQTLGLRIDSEVSLTYGEQCFAPLTPALGWLCSHLCLLPPHAARPDSWRYWSLPRPVGRRRTLGDLYAISWRQGACLSFLPICVMYLHESLL